MHFVVPATAGPQSLADPASLPAVVEACAAGSLASATALPAGKGQGLLLESQ